MSCSYLDDAEFKGSQVPDPNYESVENLMWNLPRVKHVKVPPPKHIKPESTKPVKSKSPDPGTYNPNYILLSERTKVMKIYPSKQKFFFDEQIKQSKMRPPVGTYNVSSDSFKRLSTTPL